MAEEGFKRKLTAILSADVEGYSRLMDDDEEATVRTLTSYRTSITDLVQQFRGRVVDSPGDNLLAEFTSVVDAVNCAVEIQRELAERNAELPYNRKMEFRIGVNLGDVIEEEGRIYGDGINIAARVESLSEAGGICISGRAYDQVANKLGLEYENLGEHQVKNISTPIRVYRVLSLPGAAAHRVVQAKDALGRRWRKIALAIAAGVIVVVVVLGVWQFYMRRPSVEPASVEKMAFPLPEKPSIAVLAFDNMSGDPKQDYLGDGIAEDIITQLSQIHNLFVIARNSSFSYKGKRAKVRQVAEELGVRYVLEGSVQKSGDRVRITAQLVDAITGKHLWAHRYDREVKDFFAIQDEITREVVEELAVKLVEGEGERTRLGTQNLEAWTYYRKALAQFRRFTPEAHLQARKLYKKVIELDPDFPGGYRMLSITYAMPVRFGWSKSPKEDLKLAEELANKALALNDSDPKAQSMLAYIYFLKRLYDKAIQHGQRAIALAPSIANSHARLADSLMYVGRSEEAIEEMTKAMRLAPYYPVWYLWTLGQAYYLAGRFEEAIGAFKEFQKRLPDKGAAHRWMAVVYSAWGREEQARAEAAELLRKAPTYSLENFRKRLLPYKDSTEVERILTFARKAGIPETPPLPLPDKPSIAVLPFANMSDDPKQEYFSDGITEDIITALSKVPDLFVIARNSSFTYKGKPVRVQKVGRELGVRYVLEGSVQKSANKVRITAQLVDASSGHHLWAERYDRELKEIFSLQDEITMKILLALQVKLTIGEQARSLAKGTDNIEAYLKILQARALRVDFKIDNIQRIQQLAEEALLLDPKYPSAYDYLGATHRYKVWYGLTKTPGESLDSSLKLTQKALVLDENNADAHSSLATIYNMKRQFDKAIKEIEIAISLNPNDADIHASLGRFLHNLGRTEESVAAFKKAIRLNPYAPSWYLYNFGVTYWMMGQHEKAIALCKRALERNPDEMFAHIAVAAAYSELGRAEEASASSTEALRIKPNLNLEWFEKVVPWKNKADLDRMVDALRKTGIPDKPTKKVSG